MIRKLSIATVALLAVSGCVSMSEEDCLSANWRAIGANDGVDGAAYSRLQTRTDQCGEYGIPVNIAAYNAGYEDGLRSYCTPRNGFQEGRSGSNYNGVCPAELEADFLPAYYEGRELHRLETNLRYAENALDNLYDNIDDKEDDIKKLHKNQHKEETRLPEEEYRKRLKDLEGDLKQLRRQIDNRRYDIRRARNELNAFTYSRW